MKSIVFCHIPKTGGTSVHQMLERWAGKDGITDQLKSDNYTSAVHTWGDLRVVSGHFWFKPGETLDSSRLNITLLRHPIDRVLSHYYYVRSQDATFHPSAPERSLDIDAYVESDLPSVLPVRDNFQTRLLAPLGLSPEILEPSDSDLFAAAVRAIESFDVVGIFADLADSVDVMAYLARARTGGELPHERLTEGRPPTAEVSDYVRKCLERHNEMDLRLYELAVQRFRLQRRQLFLASINTLAAEGTASGEIGAGDASGAPAKNKNDATSGRKARPQLSSRFGNRAIEVVGATVHGDVSLGSGAVMAGENVTISLRIAAHVATEDLTIGIHIRDSSGRLVFGTNSRLLGRRVSVAADSVFNVSFTFRNVLGVGRYHVGFALHTGISHLDCCYDWFDDCVMLNVVGAIGYHFEGSVGLALSNDTQSIRGGPPLISEVPESSHLIRLPRHNPPVKEACGQIQLLTEIGSMRLGDPISIEIEIRSSCDQTLESEGLRPLRICHRWYDAIDKRLIQAEGIRTNLGVDVRPGQVHRAWITVAPPSEFMGEAILRVVPVQENVGWFDQLGNFYQDIPVTIHA